MSFPELHSKYTVAQVVPVDNDLASSRPTDDPHKGERRYTRGILSTLISNVESQRIDASMDRRTCTRINSGHWGIRNVNATRMV
jgi:hypothetical protein